MKVLALYYDSSITYPNGQVAYFKGDGDNKRIVCKTWNGKTQYFIGKKDQEVQVKATFPDGHVNHFRGERGNEYKIKEVLPCGTIYYYEGEKGEEHLIKKVFLDTHTEYYQGKRGDEHNVEILYPCGKIHHYEGERGEERLVKAKFSNGEIQEFEGERHQEHKVKVTLPYGPVLFYEGEKGKERFLYAAFQGKVVQVGSVTGREYKSADRISADMVAETLIAAEEEEKANASNQKSRKASKKKKNRSKNSNVPSVDTMNAVVRDEPDAHSEPEVQLKPRAEEVNSETPIDPPKVSSEAVEVDGQCVICMDDKATHAMVPCGHMCACAACATRLDRKCPMCNAHVDMIMRVYTL